MSEEKDKTLLEIKPETKKGLNPKVFFIGLPLFVIQLAAVYFVTANILLSKFEKYKYVYEFFEMNKSRIEMIEKEKLAEAKKKKKDSGEEEKISDAKDSLIAQKEEEQGAKDNSEIKEQPGKQTVPKFIYTIENIIINPAETQGRRLMLTSVGFGVNEESQVEILKKNEVILKDVIITALSSKTIAVLSSINYRDSLRNEIKIIAKKKVPHAKIQDVYFSRYIIQ